MCRPYYVISCPSAAYKSLTQMKREKNSNLWNIFPSTETQKSALPCNNWMWNQSLISVLCRIPIKTHPSSSISQWVRPVSTVDVFIYLWKKKKEWRRSNDAFQPQGRHCRCKHEDYVTDLLNFCTFLWEICSVRSEEQIPLSPSTSRRVLGSCDPVDARTGGLQSGEANVIGCGVGRQEGRLH